MLAQFGPFLETRCYHYPVFGISSIAKPGPLSILSGKRILPNVGCILTHVDIYIYIRLFTLCCAIINLVGLGSYTAIGAIFNLTAIALDWSYCIPILCKMIFGKFEPGPWHLGRYSFWINLYSVAWTLWASILFELPLILPVTAQNVSRLDEIVILTC